MIDEVNQLARLHGFTIEAHVLQVLKLSHCNPWVMHLVHDTTMFIFLPSVLYIYQ